MVAWVESEAASAHKGHAKLREWREGMYKENIGCTYSTQVLSFVTTATVFRSQEITQVYRLISCLLRFCLACCNAVASRLGPWRYEAYAAKPVIVL